MISILLFVSREKWISLPCRSGRHRGVLSLSRQSPVRRLPLLAAAAAGERGGGGACSSRSWPWACLAHERLSPHRAILAAAVASGLSAIRPFAPRESCCHGQHRSGASEGSLRCGGSLRALDPGRGDLLLAVALASGASMRRLFGRDESLHGGIPMAAWRGSRIEGAANWVRELWRLPALLELRMRWPPKVFVRVFSLQTGSCRWRLSLLPVCRRR